MKHATRKPTCVYCVFPDCPENCPTCNKPLTSYDISGFDWNTPIRESDCEKQAFVLAFCPKKHFAFAIKITCGHPECPNCLGYRIDPFAKEEPKCTPLPNAPS